MVERHPKEALKVALNLLGTGQLSLTKVTVLVREDVPVRSFPAMLRELWYRFDPGDRMLLLPIAPLDTLDYTSYELHVGSKLVLDATGPARTTRGAAHGDQRPLGVRPAYHEAQGARWRVRGGDGDVASRVRCSPGW